jgi:hypothetical protein
MNLQQQMKVIRHQGIAVEREWVPLSSKRLPMSLAWKEHRPLRPHRWRRCRAMKEHNNRQSITRVKDLIPKVLRDN